MTKILLARLQTHLGAKLFWLVALNAIVWTPYITLQRVHFFRATIMPLSFIDRAIPFTPGAVWLYLSVYLFIPLGPFFLVDRKRIDGYIRGVIAMGMVAAMVFLFWPTVCARPEIPNATGLYRALIAFDNPYHAFPSLHAAFAIYSALCAIEVARELGWTTFAPPVAWLWAGLILYATIATRQHVLLDITAGGILGFAAYRIFLVRSSSAEPVAIMETDRASSLPRERA